MKILNTDSYKFAHHKQYPPKTGKIYSYFESRGGEYDEIVWYGLQYVLDKIAGGYLMHQDVAKARAMVKAHMGDHFNDWGWYRILEKYRGNLPIRIRALPEGSVVSPRTTLMTIENTDPEFFWITNYIETILTHLWYPTTIATNSYAIKKIVKQFFDETSDQDNVDFQVHDFGYRGCTCQEQAEVGGSAHLTSFKGTDTFPAIPHIQKHYGSDEMFGFSIPASEHSTMTTWKHELEAFGNMLDQYPTGLVACVSDSYDIQRACKDYWGVALKERIMNREGTLVVRPDSGHPVVTTENVISILWDRFGGSINSKGYKVLCPKIRMIQGDGVDKEMIRAILQNFKDKGFSAENIAFGSGGGLLQKFNRDTCKFAFKCSYAEVDGQSVDVMKRPMEWTEDGSYIESFKSSRAGQFNEPQLQTVFYNGQIIKRTTFQEIRERINGNTPS